MMDQDWYDSDGGYEYDYRRPALTGDIVALWQSHLLLATRKYNPYAGYVALPGGFINYGESALEGTAREFQEECGLAIELHRFTPLPARTNPGRDPRGWVVSIPHRVNLTEEEFETAKGGDDVEFDLVRFNLNGFGRWPQFAFDHYQIILDARFK